MGLLSSSSSISRFRIEGEIQSTFKQDYPLQIRRYSFRELDEASETERSIGWVNIMDVLDNKFIGEEFFKDNFIALSLRIDVRRVPSNALKYYVKRAEADQKARLDKKFLSRTERQEIKERLYYQLLTRAIPRTSVYDMIWNLERQEVLFSAQNDALCGEFAELFGKTFDLTLVALFPYTIAQKHLSERQLALVEEIQPCNFV